MCIRDRGTRWFTSETPGMENYHPLNHVPRGVFCTYSPRNPFRSENASHLTPYYYKAVYYAIWLRASDFYFAIWRKGGPAFADQFCKIRRDNNQIWESDGPSRQILAQNPTTRPIGLSNRKMASVFNQVKIQLSRAGLLRQQYEVHTKVRVRIRVAIDALDY